MSEFNLKLPPFWFTAANKTPAKEVVITLQLDKISGVYVTDHPLSQAWLAACVAISPGTNRN